MVGNNFYNSKTTKIDLKFLGETNFCKNNRIIHMTVGI